MFFSDYRVQSNSSAITRLGDVHIQSTFTPSLSSSSVRTPDHSLVYPVPSIDDLDISYHRRFVTTLTITCVLVIVVIVLLTASGIYVCYCFIRRRRSNSKRTVSRRRLISNESWETKITAAAEATADDEEDTYAEPGQSTT